MLRPGELRQAEWSEFDFDGGVETHGKPVWRIPAERMKLPKEEKGNANYIVNLYSTQRLHSALRYQSPIAYEQANA